MRFIQQTRNMGLKLKISEPHNFVKEINTEIVWYLKAFTDASYASDKDKRLSVTGFLIYFLGAPISWRSRLQRFVTLSITEAECVAVADVVRELMYICNILRSLGISVGLPITVYVDNLGAIFLAKNASSCVRTKHVDISYHFVREYQEDGTIMVTFVNTLNQEGDLMTKNTNSPLYVRHSTKLLGTPTIGC